MFGRLLGELGKFGREHRPDDLRGSRYQLVAAVVNLTGTKESTPASASFAFPIEGLGLRLAVKEVYLAAESAEATLDSQDPRVRGLLDAGIFSRERWMAERAAP